MFKKFIFLFGLFVLYLLKLKGYIMKNHTRVTTSFDDSVMYLSGTHQEVKNELSAIARKEGRTTDEYIIWR